MNSLRRWLFAGCFTLLAPFVQAATFTVTTYSDTGAGSLHDAIMQANTAGGANTITFDAGVFPVAPGVIAVTTALPDIANDLTIAGPGANAVLVRGNGDNSNQYRIFRVLAGRTVSISGIRIGGGYARGPHGVNGQSTAEGAAQAGLGGAIYNSGNLTVTECFFSGNTAEGGNGGNVAIGQSLTGGAAGPGLGGAIASDNGSLTVARCTFATNRAHGGNGGYGSVADAPGTNGAGGAGGAGRGGAIYVSAGSCSVVNSTFDSNRSDGGTGSRGETQTNSGGPSAAGGIGGDAEGGAIFTAVPATLTSCTIASCRASNGIGGTQFNGGFPSNFAAPGTARAGGIMGNGIVNISNTIVALNVAANGTDVISYTASDVFGAFASQNHNFIGAVDANATGFNGGADQLGTLAAPLNPKLALLADNGGRTPTLRLRRGSLAVDRGFANGLTTDQRGRARPADLNDGIYANVSDGTDIGAFESEALPNDVPIAKLILIRGSAGVALHSQRLLGSDGDGDTLTFALAGGSTLPGTLVLNADGTVTGTVNSPMEVTGSFVVSDGFATSAPGTFTIYVSEVPAYVVTTTTDVVNDLDGVISLREAITLANNSGLLRAITFDPAVFATPKTITLLPESGGGLVINRSLDITGSAAGVTVSGGNQGGLFVIGAAGAVNLRNLTFAQSAGASGAMGTYSGTVMLSGCTFQDNVTPDGGRGGAISNFGAALSLVNCTLARNSANGGGAIYQQGGTLSILNCTITGNTANLFFGPGGGGLLIEGGTVSIGNSIISNNAAGAGQDISGAFETLGFNLIGNAGGATFTPTDTDQVGSLPQFDPDGLAFNGGPTQTIALLAGSPALDRGKALGGVTTDQRGRARPFENTAITNATGGDGSDVGAFEAQAAAPEIAVKKLGGVDILDGAGSFDFGTQEVGSTTDFVFTITNKGGSLLGLTDATFTGANAESFSVITQPPSRPATGGSATLFLLFPGGSTDITVRYVPATTGAKIATVNLPSNDGDEAVFNIALTGNAVETATVAPTINSPRTNGAVYPDATITFTLPEAALAGSVKLTFDNGTVREFVFGAPEETAGRHTVGIDTAGIGMPLGLYDVTLSYQDAAGHPAASVVSTNVSIRPANAVNTARLTNGAVAPSGGVSGLPADAKLASFSIPAIDDGGHIAYVAKWTSLPKLKGTGLFLDDACLAIVGGTGPITGTTWKTFTDPVVNGGNIVTIAGLGPSAKTKVPASVVVSGSTTLVPVAAAGAIAPDATGAQPTGGATFKAFKAVAIRDGSIGIFAQLTGGTGANKVTATNDTGLWIKDGTDPLKLVLRKGQLIGGKTIKSLITFIPGKTSPGCGRGWLTKPGTGAALALVFFADKTQAVVSADAAGVTTFSKTGDPIGATELVSYSFPAANDNDTVTFSGALKVGIGGVTKADARAIFFRDRTGGYIQIAREGSRTGIIGPVDFDNLSDPVVSENGGIAFFATIKGFAFTGLRRKTLWWKSPDQSRGELVALGGARPGSDLPFDAQWKSFDSLAITDRGPIFAAKLVSGKGGVTAKTASGVWACDFTAAPRLLFRTGDTIDGKKLAKFTLLKATVGNAGVTRSFNNNAQVVWLAEFTDKSSAIITTEVP